MKVRGFGKILVAVDGSPQSENAVTVVASIARLESAGIALVHHIQAPVLVTERHPVP